MAQPPPHLAHEASVATPGEGLIEDGRGIDVITEFAGEQGECRVLDDDPDRITRQSCFDPIDDGDRCLLVESAEVDIGNRYAA